MKKGKNLYKWIRLLLRPFLKVFFPYRVIKGENLSNLPGKLLICSNHLSNLDALFLICAFKKQIFFMAKSELFKNFFMRKILDGIGTVSVKRGKDGARAIQDCKNLLLENETVVIFIAGTRSQTGEFLRPKTGAVRLANLAESAVLPICITGGGENNKVKIFKETTISIGELIPFSSIKFCENSYSEVKKYTDFIDEKIKVQR